MRWGGVRGWALFTALAMAPPALAQQMSYPSVAPGERAADVDVIGEILYDSNVARSDAQLAAKRGLIRTDESFRPSATLNLAHPVGRETLYLQGSVGYDIYRRNSVLNRERIDLQPGVLGKVGPCEGTASGDYSRHQADLADLALVHPTGPPAFVKDVVQSEQIGFNATCGRQIGLAPTVGASQSWSTNSAPSLLQVDSRTFSANGGLAYRRPSFGNVNLFGEYSSTVFPNRQFFFPFPHLVTEGYNTYAGGISYTRLVGARLVGTASASYTSLVENIPISPGFKGFTYLVNLTYHLTPRLEVIAEAKRATVPSNRIDASFSIDETYNGEVDYTLGSRWLLKIGALHLHENYTLLPMTHIDDLTNDTKNIVYGSAAYTLTRRISLSLEAQQEERSANFPGLSYSSTRVGLSARAAF